jgi:4'-phosphopantetheinyl transferase EntD
VRLDLFSEAVHVATGRCEATASLHPEEAALAQSMGAARRAEFVSGRDCARRAMRALGAAGGPVLRGPRRAPLWPDGVVGTITHTRGFCAAAVAHRADLAGVGIDAERWKPLSERVLHRICGPEEVEHLRALPHHAAELWGTAVFSAKESVYKGYFPLTATFIGFRDAEVRLHPETRDAGRFEARLVREDAPPAAGYRSFEGRFRILELEGAAIVVTGLVVPREAGAS